MPAFLPPQPSAAVPLGWQNQCMSNNCKLHYAFWSSDFSMKTIAPFLSSLSLVQNLVLSHQYFQMSPSCIPQVQALVLPCRSSFVAQTPPLLLMMFPHQEVLAKIMSCAWSLCSHSAPGSIPQGCPAAVVPWALGTPTCESPTPSQILPALGASDFPTLWNVHY